MSEMLHEMAYVDSLLDESADYNLITEVVCSALDAMKNNPQLTIAEAIQIGYNQWVK
jgi:hypothetical protein